jgi:hypothetical protein
MVGRCIALAQDDEIVGARAIVAPVIRLSYSCGMPAKLYMPGFISLAAFWNNAHAE